MAIELSLPEAIARRHVSLEERIQGTTTFKVIDEFVSTSALFPLLDAIRVISAHGWLDYLSSAAHYIIFATAFIQAWLLGTMKSDQWWARFAGNLVGFTLYALAEFMLEGGAAFMAEPYHWLFGGYSLLMGLTSALQSLYNHQPGTILLRNIIKISLFPAIYMMTELNLEFSTQITWQNWQLYMENSGHKFIIYGALFFGLLLGLTEWQRLIYAKSLRKVAHQLKQYSEWSLSPELLASAVDDPTAWQLRRVERTMLFMDIRGFTAWTEKTDPQQAVEMLNRYYKLAEMVISRHGGHKPTFTADEVMTRFETAQTALETAIALQLELKPFLADYNLAVGLGVHTGEVIEGLMGSANTRKYDIIGDAVNTAKRLESAAGPGEVVLSAVTQQALTIALPSASPRTLQVKGKSDSLAAFAITP